MSKIDYLNIGDTIYVTGIEVNLYECSEDDYEALLSVVNQTCKVVGVSDDVQLYYLPDFGTTCDYKSQRGVLIQSPKLQGHDGGGRCPEYNCYWIGKDYLSFESMSMDDTMNIFDKLNESDDFGWAEEIIKDVPNAVDYRTVKQGDKVVPGKDWLFGNQAQGSVYGIVDMEEYGGEPAYIEDSTDEEFWQYWVHVDWINKKGDVMFRNNYRVGPEYHDLKYYTPKPAKRKKGIKESKENIQEITHNDLRVGMTVIVDGYDVVEKTQKWENEIGTVVYNYNEDEDETGNSFTISFKNWAKGHDGLAAECGRDKCWSFYDDCAYSNESNCQNISNVKFYTVNTYDLFDQLNESEEDELEWAKDIINQGVYDRYENILPYLDNDDIISITGEFTDDEGNGMLYVKDAQFRFEKTMGERFGPYLYWVQPITERPEGWGSITGGNGSIPMGANTFEWDKDLMVKIIHKEYHPF